MGLFITRRVKRGAPVGPQVPARFYNDVDEVLTNLSVHNGHIERQHNRWTIVFDELYYDSYIRRVDLVADELSHHFESVDTVLRRSEDYGWTSPTFLDTLADSDAVEVRPVGGTAKRYMTWASLLDYIGDRLTDTGGPWSGDSGHAPPWDTGLYWRTDGDTSTCRGQSAKITSTDPASSTAAPFYAAGGAFVGNGMYVRYADGYTPPTRAVSMCIDTYAVNAEQGNINVNDSGAYCHGGDTGKTHTRNIVLFDTAGDSFVFRPSGGIMV